jgi:two-component system, LytTR family, response regulator
MKLRVLIAEDEELSREHLRKLLESEPQIEITAECRSGKEALAAFGWTRPDVLLLDVRLPELDGFGVISALTKEDRPIIIFVTGSESFALRAFESEAADYLLKPFHRERLQAALGRARERLAARKLISEQNEIDSPLDRLTIKSESRISIVRTAEVDWMSAADNYVEIHVGKSRHLMRTTVTALLARLPRKLFARISRSALVNVERVKEIHPQTHGDYFVVMNNGTRLRGSRKYRADFAEMLSGQTSGEAKNNSL